MTPKPAHGYRARARGSNTVAVAADHVTDVCFAERDCAAAIVEADPARAAEGSPLTSQPTLTVVRSAAPAPRGDRVIGPDGVLYRAGRSGTEFAVSMSYDDAASWTVRTVPGSGLRAPRGRLHGLLFGSGPLLPNSVAVDALGSIYAVWPDPRGTLFAAWSADGGDRWSQPVVVSAPDVSAARLGAIAVAEPGHVAIAYQGREGGRTLNGYVASCTDFRVENPTFVGGRFDDDDAPIDYRGTMSDGLGVDIAPDGEVLVSAVARLRGARRHRPWSIGGWRGRTKPVLGRLVRRAM